MKSFLGIAAALVAAAALGHCHGGRQAGEAVGAGLVVHALTCLDGGRVGALVERVPVVYPDMDQCAAALNGHQSKGAGRYSPICGSPVYVCVSAGGPRDAVAAAIHAREGLERARAGQGPW